MCAPHIYYKYKRLFCRFNFYRLNVRNTLNYQLTYCYSLTPHPFNKISLHRSKYNYRKTVKKHYLCSIMEAPCSSICNGEAIWKWDVQPFTQFTSSFKYAVLVLNRPITQNLNYIENLWNNASVRITVDGGTNRWDAYTSSLPKEVQQTLKNPDLVSGDFDSISKDILEIYKNKGCKIINTPDQNYTDFTKALMLLNNYCQEHECEVDNVIVLAQSSGRLDHTLANIQTLYLAKDKCILSPKMQVFLISDDTISWLISPGKHIIKVPEDTRLYKKSFCSLVPVGEVCESATTRGLKWNLNGTKMMFGGLVSTSNAFDGSEEVYIECSHTLLWSMRVPTLGASWNISNGKQ